MSKMVADSIPQLQAQIAQISAMLQNPTLPQQVRQNTQIQHHQLQIQLAQAQEMATALALANFQQQQLNSVAGMNYTNLQGYNQTGLRGILRDQRRKSGSSQSSSCWQGVLRDAG